MKSGRHDTALRRRALRQGREKGCRVYIAAEQLEACGIDPNGERPWYRIYPGEKEKRGRLVVQLFREP